MKTKVFLFAALAAATVSMTSCNSDDETIDNTPVEIRLSSTNEASLTTRSTDQAIQLTQFKNNEKIKVFINEDGEAQTALPLEYTANGGGVMTPPALQFFPQSGNGVNIHAFYPLTATDDLVTPKTFAIATDQSTDAAYKASDLMYGVPASNPVARTSSEIQLTFEHLLSKVNIELKVGNGSPTLVGSTVKLKGIKPETTFDPLDGSITAAAGTATDITVMATNNVSLAGSVIIIPQTLSGAFIEVTLPSGGVLTYTLPAATEFEGKKQYDYEITVNLTGLTVKSEISPWGNGGNSTGTAVMN
jgi:hypothetical protein